MEIRPPSIKSCPASVTLAVWGQGPGRVGSGWAGSGQATAQVHSVTRDQSLLPALCTQPSPQCWHVRVRGDIWLLVARALWPSASGDRPQSYFGVPAVGTLLCWQPQWLSPCLPHGPWAVWGTDGGSAGPYLAAGCPLAPRGLTVSEQRGGQLGRLCPPAGPWCCPAEAPPGFAIPALPSHWGCRPADPHP